MLKHLVTFFYPKSKDFHYQESSEVVKAKVNSVLNRKFSIWDTTDITGRFTSEDTFVIFLSGRRPPSSGLSCKIIQQEDGTTIIRTKAGPGMEYFFFFLSLIGGIAYMYNAFQKESGSFYLLSIACMVLGPILSIGYSNVSIGAINERYWLYIHKELAKGE
jgi:hypothetical protein